MARISEVDALRGIAIALMVVYHVIFNLSYFGIAAIDLGYLPLVLLQRTIGTLFILLVGVSLSLSESRNRGGYAHHAKRALGLGAVSIAITLATWIYPHEGFITFGVIHFIALSTFVAPLFLGLGRLNVLLGLALVIAGFFVEGVQTESPYLFWLGLTTPSYTALDFYPMLPWFGIVLIGIFAGQVFFPEGRSRLKAAPGRLTEKMAFLGRHSLAIYLAHQPALVAIMLAYKSVFMQ